MKLKGFDELGMSEEQVVAHRAEEEKKSEDVKKGGQGKVDRRPKGGVVPESQESGNDQLTDEAFIEQARRELSVSENGDVQTNPPTEEDVRRQALRIKFRGMQSNDLERMAADAYVAATFDQTKNEPLHIPDAPIVPETPVTPEAPVTPATPEAPVSAQETTSKENNEADARRAARREAIENKRKIEEELRVRELARKQAKIAAQPVRQTEKFDIEAILATRRAEAQESLNRETRAKEEKKARREGILQAANRRIHELFTLRKRAQERGIANGKKTGTGK